MPGTFPVKQKQNSPFQPPTRYCSSQTLQAPNGTRGCHRGVGEGRGAHGWVWPYLRPVSSHGLETPLAPSTSELRLVDVVEKLIVGMCGSKETLDQEKRLWQRNILTLKILSISAASSGPTNLQIAHKNPKPLPHMLCNLDINKSCRSWKYLWVSIFGLGTNKIEILSIKHFGEISHH